MSRKSFLKTLQKDVEFSKEMKEKFYQIKIIEAIEKKALPFFDWEGLPAEIELRILDFKKEIEKTYIPSIIKKEHLTIKSYNEFMFKQYKNEHGEKLKTIVSVTKSTFSNILWSMINKEHYDGFIKCSSAYSEMICAYDRITENKTPSLEEYINYRKEEKKKTNEKNRLKKEEQNKSDFKKNDIFYLSRCACGYGGCCCEVMSNHAYKIISETKTLFKVALIEWTKEQFVGDSKVWNEGQDEEEIKKYIYALDKDNIKLTRRADGSGKADWCFKKTMNPYMFKLKSGTEFENYKGVIQQPDDFNINWLFIIQNKRRSTPRAVYYKKLAAQHANWVAEPRWINISYKPDSYY